MIESTFQTRMNKDFWEKKYQNQATGWDLGTVSPPLKAYFDQLTDKNLRILIPGCGFGHEAIYLEQQGFTNITVIDLVEEALDLIRVNAPNVNCVAGDFFNFSSTFDRIIEQTLFCAIDPSLRLQYIQKTASLLSENGKYVGLLFNRDFEDGPPFGGSTQEYQTYFSKHFHSFSMETCYNSAQPRSGNEVFFIAKK